MRRWQVEVTFEEARRHLGGEVQRGRSDAIIARTTPAVLGLVVIVTLLASHLMGDGTLPVRAAAWYAKHTPTFIDALAAVRARWRRPQRVRPRARNADIVKLPRRVAASLGGAASYMA